MLEFEGAMVKASARALAEGADPRDKTQFGGVMLAGLVRLIEFDRKVSRAWRRDAEKANRMLKSWVAALNRVAD